MKTNEKPKNRKAERNVNVSGNEKPKNRTNPNTKVLVKNFGYGEDVGFSSAHSYPDNKAKFNSDADVTLIEFFEHFNPPTATAQKRRHTKRGTYMPADVKRAKALYLAIFKQYSPAKPATGPLGLHIFWTFPGTDAMKTTRPDLDNLEKLALDAMTQAEWWNDDAQVCRKLTIKMTGSYPGMYVKLFREHLECGAERVDGSLDGEA